MGESEHERMEFIRAAINDHRGSAAYRMALDAEQYYDCLLYTSRLERHNERMGIWNLLHTLQCNNADYVL